ncbi:hypothetical protein OIU91_21260 [Streptomyces sp. NBC_01456]|uniref:zinc finger domain-containing protein n=1 Tax=unclassified Streptomyces TaxID=2593676 RepID=UPI002E322504|nr:MULTISPECIES: hypothetical protein [unclassified Streptomyces]
MDIEIWATTQSYGLFHAFDDEGRALCRRTIRPRSTFRITREKIADYPLTTPCERCTKKADALVTEAKAAEQGAPEGEQATTYAARGAVLKTTGHYRRPGTRDLFCGRPAGGRNGIFANVSGWHLCARCVTAEARDRAEAAVVADTHLAAPVEDDDQAVTLEDLADAVICPECHVAAGVRCITRAGKPAREPHGRRFEAMEQAAGITQHRATARREAQARGYTSTGLDHKAEQALLTAYAARINACAQVDDEQRLAAALVTEADATDGTWQGAWIGQDADATLFERPADQGALFS